LAKIREIQSVSDSEQNDNLPEKKDGHDSENKAPTSPKHGWNTVRNSVIPSIRFRNLPAIKKHTRTRDSVRPRNTVSPENEVTREPRILGVKPARH